MIFRWAVIGTPKKVREIFSSLTATGRHKAVAAFSVNQKELKRFVNAFGAKSYSAINDILADEEVDGVFLALPVTYRYAVTLEAIKAGKPVFSLPAATVNDTQIKKAMATAMEYNVFYGVADVCRYYNLVEECERLIYADVIGDIYEIRATASESVENTRAVDQNNRSGAILTAAPHMLSMAELFLGYPKNVKCHDIRVQYGVDTIDRIEMNYDDATCRINCSLSPVGTNKIKLFGRFGTMSISFKKSTCVVRLKIHNCRTRYKRETNGYVTMFDKVVRDIRLGNNRMNENLNWSSMVDIARMIDACRQKIGLFYSTNIESTLPKALPDARHINNKKSSRKKQR